MVSSSDIYLIKFNQILKEICRDSHNCVNVWLYQDKGNKLVNK